MKKAFEYKRWQLLLFFWLSIPFVILITPLLPYFFGPVLLGLIWTYPKKDEEFFDKRFMDPKNHKWRVGFSIVVLLFILLAVMGKSSMERKELEEKNYPTPSIEILSSQEKQSSSEYKLIFSSSDYEAIFINGEKTESSGEVFEKNIPLKSLETKISILATNRYKKFSKTVVIQRLETKEEGKARIDAENLKKTKQEAINAKNTQRKKEELKKIEKEVESLIENSDNFNQYKKAFINHTSLLVKEKKCTIEDLLKNGGWTDSQNTEYGYFIFCGGMTIENKQYFDPASNTDNTKKYHSERLKKKQKAKEQKAKIERQFSQWDGSHIKFKALIKSALKNPSSFEHVKTTYSVQGDRVFVFMSYRGTNSFNAIITESAKGVYSIDGDFIRIIK